MLQEECLKRSLPPLFAQEVTEKNFEEWKKKIVDLYSKECFGITPPAPTEVRSAAVVEEKDYLAGKAIHREVILSFDTEKGEFSFPVHLVIPKGFRPCPCVVYPSFAPYAADCYQPIEEIADQGFALAVFCYEDVTTDDGNFGNGLAALTSRDTKESWGKIGMWAYACSRVLDYLLTLPEIDVNRVAVAGHSRLGKTALWAAAQDTRFAGAYSNDSGCSGAAVSRGKIGESVGAIYERFPYWFCENYGKYGNHEDSMPFEQYQLLACIAPRPLYVASATEDAWADPFSEFLSAAITSQAWETLGVQGLGTEEMPGAGGRIASGRVGYHLRPGTHYLSRYDWVRALQFFRLNL